jgi:monoamine oxidase
VKRWDAIIVGGGFAGVTAARDLSSRGYAVLLLEARDRLGGRTYFKYSDALQRHADLGGTSVLVDFQPHVMREIKRYGIEVESTERIHIDRYRWLLGGTIRSGFPISSSEAPAAERALRHVGDAARRISFGRPLASQSIADLDVSLLDFLGLVSPPTELIDLLMSLNYGLVAGQSAADASALQLLSWIAGTDNNLMAFYMATRYRLVGGSVALINAMSTGGSAQIRLSTPVAGIRRTDDLSVEVRSASGEELSARAVVLAVPVNCLASIELYSDRDHAFWVEKKKAAEAVNGSRAVKVVMKATGLPDNVFGAGPAGGLKVVFTDDRLDDGSSILVGFGTADSIDPTALTELSRAVQEYFPEARVIASECHDWNTDPYSNGAWMSPKPGAFQRQMPELQTAEGNIVLAGADVADGFNVWIDAAIENGAAAAARVHTMLSEAKSPA